MPPLSPTGGFSIIIHLFVNVVTFCYKGLTIFLQKHFHLTIGRPPVHHLSSKKGDTSFRRISAYLMTFIVFVVIAGTAYIIVSKGIALRRAESRKNISTIVQNELSSSNLQTLELIEIKE